MAARRSRHGGKTIEEMLPSYAVSDCSGKANVKAYAEGIYAVGDAQGVTLRDKKIGELNAAEMSALQDGMRKVEGYKVGDVKMTPPSQRQLEEKSMQKMEEQGLGVRSVTSANPTTSAAASPKAGLDSPDHSGHSLFKQAQAGMQAIDAKFGRTLNQQTDNAAGVVAVQAQSAGMTRIDVMDLGGQGDKIIAAQGQPGSALSKVIDVPTVQALNTPLAESSQAFADALQARLAANQSTRQQAMLNQMKQHAAPSLA